MKTPSPDRPNRKSILWLILVAMLATAASGCSHLLDIFLNSPYITTKKLPNGTVGVAYAGKVNASFDLGADWWISDGQLPPGLLFEAARISGTPTVGGTFKFEVTVSSTGADEVHGHLKHYRTDARACGGGILSLVCGCVSRHGCAGSRPRMARPEEGKVIQDLLLELFEVKIDGRSDEKGDELRHNQAADHNESQRPA
jgi:hypothetical protein